jgi:hypothetical protein
MKYRLAFFIIMGKNVSPRGMMLKKGQKKSYISEGIEM